LRKDRSLHDGAASKGEGCVWMEAADRLKRQGELGRKSCNTSRPDELLLFGNVCMLEIERRTAVLREELF
jgi:hypothetical protein